MIQFPPSILLTWLSKDSSFDYINSYAKLPWLNWCLKETSFNSSFFKTDSSGMILQVWSMNLPLKNYCVQLSFLLMPSSTMKILAMMVLFWVRSTHLVVTTAQQAHPTALFHPSVTQMMRVDCIVLTVQCFTCENWWSNKWFRLMYH